MAMADYRGIKAFDANESFTKIRKTYGNTYDSLAQLLDGLDERIIELHQDEIDNLEENQQNLEDSDLMIRDAQNGFNNAYNGLQQTKRKVSDINPRVEMPTVPLKPTGPKPTNPQEKDFVIPTDDWEDIPPEIQDTIEEKLKDHGLTDEDIEKILKQLVSIDGKTFAEIKAELTDAIKHNPALIVKLEEVLGFPILDENNEVDETRLGLAIFVANKNLGMDVDMTEGTPFRRDINSLTIDLQSLYRKDPTIRSKITSIYGVDIFDINGKVDQEKLAVVRIIDGIDKKDGFDIKRLIPKNTVNPVPDPTNPPTTPTNPPTSPTTAPTNPPTTPTTPPTTVPDTDPITPVIDPKDDTKLATSVGEVGGGILDAIEKGASRLARGISPYSGNVGATKGMNKATAGIIAAASVAAGGVAAGGGVLVSKKLNMIHFTPADWAALGPDYQSIIETHMRKVGFSTDDVETFKTSNFKIPLSELREHTKKIEKALDSNPTCDDELLKLYNFSMIDDQNKVIDYLLFITMIIDGRNTIDEYNMYNVINQSLDDVDEADFLYNGIDMEDYFDDSDNIEVQMYNNPLDTIPNIEEEEAQEEPVEEQKEPTYSGMDKEWLKGIGIDD